jgi:hypothetical protein
LRKTVIKEVGESQPELSVLSSNGAMTRFFGMWLMTGNEKVTDLVYRKKIIYQLPPAICYWEFSTF